MSDFDARRRMKGNRIDAAAMRKPGKIIFYGCTNMDCRYSWATIEGQEVTVCSRCGTPGRQTGSR